MISITPFITPDRTPGELQTAIMELWKMDAALSACVPKPLRAQLIHLLRVVNSFYSNKIEGNPTEPAEILRTQELSGQSTLSDHLLEIKQHVEVQNKLAFSEISPEIVCSSEFIKGIHLDFYKDLPEQFLVQINEDTGEEIRVTPGEFRNRNVKVGAHVPPDADEINSLMAWFYKTYNPVNLFGLSPILAAAAAHHRFTWIHPFLDGNGRVGRILTDSYMSTSGFSGYGLWSMSRGFGRDTKSYYKYLALADQGRKGVQDGRGILSDDGLLEFTKYFINVAVDQVQYFSNILDVQKLTERLDIYFELRAKGAISSPTGQSLPELRLEARDVYTHILNRGPMNRSDIQRHLGLSDKTTRAIIHDMRRDELIVAPAKGLVTLALPMHLLAVVFPYLW